MEFSGTIINWYEANKRDLPWRRTTDPYKIWISEVILQQTRVDQGLSYYCEFVKKFPDLKALRSAEESVVLNVVSGIGYYRRFLNMRDSAEQIFREFRGIFPDNFEALKKLKGIGPYTAAAIASFAFKERVPVVDGNVYRLLARYFAEKTPIDTAKGKQLFFDFANRLICKRRPDVFNQAIMELGALVCKPSKPDCKSCPLVKDCKAHKSDSIKQYPVKTKGKVRKVRYLYFLDIRMGDEIILEKRVRNDIWKNLYAPLMIETDSEMSDHEILKSNAWKAFFSTEKRNQTGFRKNFKHILTHQEIRATFFKIHIKRIFELKANNVVSVTAKNIDDYPLPRLIEKYFQNE